MSSRTPTNPPDRETDDSANLLVNRPSEQADAWGAVRHDVGVRALIPAYALGIHPDPTRHLRLPESRKVIVRDTGHLGLLDSREGHGEIVARLRAAAKERSS